MTQREKAERLRALHHADPPVVFLNAWDVASACIVEAAGFPAIATSSAGVANALGFPDGQAISRDEMLGMVARIARAVALPVTADLERAYGDGVADAAETAHAAIAAGAVGLNLEDGENEGERLLDVGLQAARIGAMRAQGDATGVPLVINARTDAFWSPHGTPQTRFDETVKRARAYADAGADCIFVPGARSADEIAALVGAIDAPLNILATTGTPNVAELARLGVKRVSLGSSPMAYAMAALRDIAQTLHEDGTFAFVGRRIPYSELNALVQPST